MFVSSFRGWRLGGPLADALARERFHLCEKGLREFGGFGMHHLANREHLGVDQFFISNPYMTMDNFFRSVGKDNIFSGFPQWSSHVKDLLINPTSIQGPLFERFPWKVDNVEPGGVMGSCVQVSNSQYAP